MIFHDYVITWWQAGMLKIALLAFGIVIGACWPVFFKKPVVRWILWLIFIIFSLWLTIALWPQIFHNTA